MKIITLQTASSLGFKPNEYSSDIDLLGKAVKLDFRTKGRGEWIDCYFSCAKGTGNKYKLPVFLNAQNKFSPTRSFIDFSSELHEGKVFVVSAELVNGRAVWTKALKVM